MTREEAEALVDAHEMAYGARIWDDSTKAVKTLKDARKALIDALTGEKE